MIFITRTALCVLYNKNSQLQASSPSISVTRGEEVSSSSGRYYSAVETSRMVCSLVTHLSQALQEIRMVMHEPRGW